MYCNNCKVEYFSGKKLCPNCGKRGNTKKSGKKKIELGTIMKIGAAIMAIFFIVGLISSFKENKKNKNKPNSTTESNQIPASSNE